MRFFSFKSFIFRVSIISCKLTMLSSSILFGTSFDWFSLHSAHLSWIKIVSVYDSPCPILCKSVITSLEPVFLYTFSNNNTWGRGGFAFDIKVSISPQILETLLALTWDNFTVSLSSKVELGLTIDAIGLTKFYYWY